MISDFMFTSESVTRGHPDKICDQISDAIVDQFLARDPQARITAESAVAKGIVFIAARFASDARIDIPDVARQVIHDIGYQQGEFSARECSILTSLSELPAELRSASDPHDWQDSDMNALTAQHQITGFGFACNQTEALMPMPVSLAHELAQRLAQVRASGRLPYLTPDGTVQVGVEYRNRQPRRVHSITIVVSQETADGPHLKTLREAVTEEVVHGLFTDKPVQPDQHTRIFVNPDGPRIGGGPSRHAGLTGRKTAADTYGQYARYSASAMSGKDPLRVDRVAAYAARHAAKNVVAAGLARECEVQLSYTIGLARPVSLQVDTFDTGLIEDSKLSRLLEQLFDFRLGGIIRGFELAHLPARRRDGFYRRLSAYGQVGRTDLDTPWEQTDQAEALRDMAHVKKGQRA